MAIIFYSIAPISISGHSSPKYFAYDTANFSLHTVGDNEAEHSLTVFVVATASSFVLQATQSLLLISYFMSLSIGSDNDGGNDDEDDDCSGVVGECNSCVSLVCFSCKSSLFDFPFFFCVALIFVFFCTLCNYCISLRFIAQRCTSAYNSSTTVIRASAARGTTSPKCKPAICASASNLM